MKFDINILRQYEEKKLISCKKHPTEDLYIWNYTPQVQFDNLWDEITMQCRGLITDEQGNFKYRPFKKFWGFNTTEETKIENLPNEIPIITEKLDGSMGILYFTKDERPCIATRGSFESEQAIWATNWIRSKENLKYEYFLPEYTYVWEILYKQNRIVISYGDREELVLLAVINTETGNEIDHIKEATRLGVSSAKKIDKPINELINFLNIMDSQEEGFVVKYSNGLRTKMKSVEYLRVHRLVTGFSSRSIWEALMNGQKLEEVMYALPDEFMSWCRKKEQELLNQYNELFTRSFIAYVEVKGLPTQKDKALVIMSKYKDIAGIVFAMIKAHGKEVDKLIWKMIEPKWELPFRADTEQGKLSDIYLKM